MRRSVEREREKEGKPKWDANGMKFQGIIKWISFHCDEKRGHGKQNGIG